MDGPRSLRPREMPSLLKLVDTVFFEGRPSMGRMFPLLFRDANTENLVVFEDEGRIVSHVGMTHHRASIGGCGVGVSCVGAVATYSEYRGRGLASRLMEFAIEKSLETGSQIMLISGGRGLYRRLGAADYGLDSLAVVTRDVASSFYNTEYELRDFSEDHLESYRDFYQRKPAHFVRTVDEWRILTKSGYCMCRPVELFTLFRDGSPVAYYVVWRNPDLESIQIMEFAGDPMALAGALHPLLERYAARHVRLDLQYEDEELRACLANGGAEISPTHNPHGTLLILDLEGLIGSLHPYLEKEKGLTSRIRVREPGANRAYRLELEKSAKGSPLELEGRKEAAEFVFGNPNRVPQDHPLEQFFPVPSLTYGLNFV